MATGSEQEKMLYETAQWLDLLLQVSVNADVREKRSFATDTP